MQISVLMSVYKNEKAPFFREAVQSMINQTRKPDEIVIVEDGPLTTELYDELRELETVYPNVIKRVPLRENVGLGLALRFGVENCTYPLIARMDSDDISIPTRLEKQESEFHSDSDLDIIGGHIAEFNEDIEDVVAFRKVPLSHSEIIKYQRQRSALNHVTVMFKKSAVIQSGNYEGGLYMEDDLLWHNMISNGCKMKNLDEVLCYVRVGDGMYERRGGLNYLKFYAEARRTMLSRKQIKYSDFISSILIQFIVAIVPTKLRKQLFQLFLRKK